MEWRDINIALFDRSGTLEKIKKCNSAWGLLRNEATALGHVIV
jgi:hypothetical protein